MSIFSEVLSGQQAQADQPYHIQQFLQAQRAAQQEQQLRAAQEQRQNQQFQMGVEEARRQKQIQDTTRQQGAEGAGAFSDYFKNMGQAQEGPAIAPGVKSATEALQAAGAPNVGVSPMLKQPEMQPMNIQSVAASIYKNNPNISPEGFISALERFEPVFERNDKLQLAQLRKQAAGGSGGTDYARTLQHYLDAGLPYAEAEKEALKVKRTGAEETSAVTTAKKEAELGVTREAGLSKAQSSLNTLERKTGNLEKTINDAQNIITENPNLAVNWGSYTSFVPNSPAGQLKGLIQEIKANSTVNELQEMRSNSPTGGALGNVSNYEDALLAAVNGVLDPAQGNLLNRNLDVIKQMLPAVLKDRKAAFEQDYGGTKGNKSSSKSAGAAPAQTMDFSQLPE